MLNRRKAMIGWMAYSIGKPVVMRAMKSKARKAALAESGQGKGRSAAKMAGFIAAAAAAAGAVMFWRSRSENGGAPKSDAPGASEAKQPEPASSTTSTTGAVRDKPPS